MNRSHKSILCISISLQSVYYCWILNVTHCNPYGIQCRLIYWLNELLSMCLTHHHLFQASIITSSWLKAPAIFEWLHICLFCFWKKVYFFHTFFLTAPSSSFGLAAFCSVSFPSSPSHLTQNLASLYPLSFCSIFFSSPSFSSLSTPSQSFSPLVWLVSLRASLQLSDKIQVPHMFLTGRKTL